MTVEQFWQVFCKLGCPCSSGGRAGAPSTEAVSSLQQPLDSIPLCGPLLHVIPSLSTQFHVQSYSCPINKSEPWVGVWFYRSGPVYRPKLV